MKLIRPLIALTAAVCSITASFGHDHNPGSGARALDFIENKGQWEAQAKFKADIPDGAMFITDRGFVYNFFSRKDMDRIHELTCGEKRSENADIGNEKVARHAYKVNFVGANSTVSYQTSEKRSHYNNYFIGNDRSRWAGRVGIFGRVEQENVYNGVDVVVYSSGSSSIKYDFVVAAGADPSQIKLSFEGVVPQITAEGNLRIKTSVNEVVEKAPFTYQVVDGQKITVPSKYRLEKGVLKFEFPHGYNRSHELVIDPDLVFATYSGGTGSNYYAHSTTYDGDGNMYVGALGDQTGWPTTVGAFQQTSLGGSSVAINKYDATGATLMFSTYYSGSGSYDVPNAMRVNSLNELVVVGATNSSNIPTTTGTYDNTLGGASDLFVAHFTAAGDDLIGATYMGGSGVDGYGLDVGTEGSSVTLGGAKTSPCEIGFDDQNNIWVVSNTASSDFPVTSGAQQSTLGGGYDGVIFKLDPTCSNLMYSSYLGGTNNDAIYNIIFDEAGDIVIGGGTKSTNFPTTAGAFKTTAPGGDWDGFICKINSVSGAITASTYMGTTGGDNITKLQIDCAGNIYALGRVKSATYPVSPGVWSMPGRDVFISKMNNSLSSELLSTTVGGTGSYLPTAFLLDVCGNVYIAGLSSGTINDLPVTPDAFDITPKPFWFCVLEPNFSNLHFGSYFGSPSGDHMHVGTSHFDPDGFVYHSVCASSTSFPTTPGSWSPNKQNTSLDIVSFKFDFEANPIKIKETSSAGGLDTATHCIRGCKSAFVEISRLAVDPEPVTVKFTKAGTAVFNSDYQLLVNGTPITDSIVILPNQLSTTIEVKPLLVPVATGVREAIINVLSPCGCDGGGDQIVEVAKVKIYDSLYVAILTPFDTVCPNTPITIEAEIDSTLTYHWSPAIYDQGSLIINPSPIATSRYSITVTQPGAPATCPPRTATYEAFVEPVPHITLPVKDITICAGDSLDINVYAQPDGTDYRYQWSPPDYLRDDFSPNNKFNGPIGDYKKVIRVSTPVAGCESFDSMYIHVVPPFQFSWVAPVDTTIKYGDQIQLDSESDAIMWLWTPVTYLSDPLAKQPYATPLEDITYQVIGIDQYGCKDTAEVHINVEFQSMANIPNAFTPNGDGHNDVFKIMNREFEKMTEFRVFNRYGQVVFETIDPEKGWDGTIDGKPASSDVYHYIIRLVMPGGIDKVYKGDLTLLR